MASSTASLLDDLRQYRLLDAAQLAELTALQRRWPDPKALARELMQRDWLTPYQANQLLQGRGQELLLGSYVLLTRIGEGGMGQVFKARNWKLGRVVAIKVIRKQRLNNPEIIRRFQREVRAVAALTHPNIVMAYDADEINGTHFLVMEYIDGATDLAGLVKKNGPLPVAQACELIRQAALGLQHAAERGLVHRDIKPQNLLLAGGSVVKILDMGLARLDVQATDDEKSSTMTQEGALMGTLDYLSPEQAQESHTVDIRSDIYSLGCTFYFLLTGRVPFPGGTLVKKLDKHRFEEPKAIEELRPHVPGAVTAIVRKMMAKKPEERFQQPAELAAALTDTLQGLREIPVGAQAADQTLADGTIPSAVPISEETVAFPVALLATSAEVVRPVPAIPHLGGGQRRWWLLSGAAASVLLVGLVVCLFVLVKLLSHRKGPIPEKKPPQAVVIPPPQKTESFVTLFNGKDLTGWNIDGPNGDQWSVEGDTIVGRSNNAGTRTYLLTNQDHADYILRFDFKVEEGSHGGVAIRAIEGEKMPGNGFDHPLLKLTNPYRSAIEPTGTTHWLKNASVNEWPVETLSLPTGAWHAMEVVVRGNQCTATIDNKPLVNVTLDPNGRKVEGFQPGLERVKGKVGFQVNTGTLRFRKIEIREFSANEAKEDVQSKQPPTEALILFDGKNFDHWTKLDGQSAPGWKLTDGGAMQVAGGGDLVTKEKFTGTFRLHVEFRVPYLPNATGQGRGNSGVYLQGRYEVQILDSYGLDSKDDDCGAIYRVSKPWVNACKAPLVWQSYDIEYTAPRYDGGQLAEPAVMTVYQNGTLIQDHVKITVDSTLGGLGTKNNEPGPIRLQDHGDPVEFRNIWIVKIK